MQKNRSVHKDYNQVINNSSPLSLEILEEIIPVNDSVRLLNQIREELNYERLI